MGNCTSIQKDGDEDLSLLDSNMESDDLIFETYYVQSLAAASYLIGSRRTGHCVIIDPRRDVSDYMETMGDENLRCVSVLLTHLHSDFVNGYAELSDRFKCDTICNDDLHHERVKHINPETYILSLSMRFTITAVSTPGHTPGSLTFVLSDNGIVSSIFTGDTLIPGGVGCVDGIAWNKNDEREHEYALSCLHESFHTVILSGFSPRVEVYAAHGYGSHHLPPTPDSSTWTSTIGDEIRSNHAAFLTNHDRFVAFVAVSATTPTLLSGHIADVNRRGATPLRRLFDGIPQVQPQVFAERMTGNPSISRHRDDSSCSSEDDEKCESDGLCEQEEEVMMDLSVVLRGFGYEMNSNLNPNSSSNGPNSTSQSTSYASSHSSNTSSSGLSLTSDAPSQMVISKYGIPCRLCVDVRTADEYAAAHIPGAINVPVGRGRGILMNQFEGRVELLLSNLVTQYSEICLIGDGTGELEFEAVLRLSRIGLDECVVAICEGGISSWCDSRWNRPIEVSPRLHINTQNDWRSVLRSYRIFDLNACCDRAARDMIEDSISSKCATRTSLSDVTEDEMTTALGRLRSGPLERFDRLRSSPLDTASMSMRTISVNKPSPLSLSTPSTAMAKVKSCPDLIGPNSGRLSLNCANNKRFNSRKRWRSVNNCPFIGNPFVWKVASKMDKLDRYALCDSHDWNATVYASILRSCGMTVCDIAGGVDWSEVNLETMHASHNIGWGNHSFANGMHIRSASHTPTFTPVGNRTPV